MPLEWAIWRLCCDYGCLPSLALRELGMLGDRRLPWWWLPQTSEYRALAEIHRRVTRLDESTDAKEHERVTESIASDFDSRVVTAYFRARG